ncbi:MAG: chemotaxis protein CheX [Acidobacteriota bacterium]|nr:chemotaxis protein CheX [Acidobacteriota bacterium]
MPRTDLQQIFLESVGEVLETMFFTGVVEEDSNEESDSLVSAELTFHGNRSGRFGVRVPHTTGRQITSSFLGLEEDELSEEQIGEVVCELTNMICGSVLSRVETGARFELMHPEVDPRNGDWRKYKDATGSTFGLEEGTITVWMTLEENRPALVA